MVIKQQKNAAEQLGITATALRKWQKEPGFPDCRKGYDVSKIEKWLNDRQKKGSQTGDRLQAINTAIKAQKLRIDKSKADRIEDEREIEKGNLIPRDEFEIAVIEQITIARDYIKPIPKLLCKFVPKKYHKKLMAEGDRIVRKTFDNLAQELERIIQEGADT